MEDRYTDIISQIKLTLGAKNFGAINLITEIKDIYTNTKESEYVLMLNVLNNCFPYLEKSGNTNLVIDTWMLMQQLKIKIK